MTQLQKNDAPEVEQFIDKCEDADDAFAIDSPAGKIEDHETKTMVLRSLKSLIYEEELTHATLAALEIIATNISADQLQPLLKHIDKRCEKVWKNVNHSLRGDFELQKKTCFTTECAHEVDLFLQIPDEFGNSASELEAKEKRKASTEREGGKKKKEPAKRRHQPKTRER